MGVVRLLKSPDSDGLERSPEVSDAELNRLARLGWEWALDALFRRQLQMVLRRAYRLAGGDAELGREIALDAIVHSLATVRSGPPGVRYEVVVCAELARAAKKLLARSKVELLGRTEEDTVLLVLRRVERLSPLEISLDMGIPLATLRRKLQAAERAALRRGQGSRLAGLGQLEPEVWSEEAVAAFWVQVRRRVSRARGLGHAAPRFALRQTALLTIVLVAGALLGLTLRYFLLGEGRRFLIDPLLSSL